MYDYQDFFSSEMDSYNLDQSLYGNSWTDDKDFWEYMGWSKSNAKKEMMDRHPDRHSGDHSKWNEIVSKYNTWKQSKGSSSSKSSGSSSPFGNGWWEKSKMNSHRRYADQEEAEARREKSKYDDAVNELKSMAAKHRAATDKLKRKLKYQRLGVTAGAAAAGGGLGYVISKDMTRKMAPGTKRKLIRVGATIAGAGLGGYAGYATMKRINRDRLKKHHDDYIWDSGEVRQRARSGRFWHKYHNDRKAYHEDQYRRAKARYESA